jgi:hypothetical protein
VPRHPVLNELQDLDSGPWFAREGRKYGKSGGTDGQGVLLRIQIVGAS